MQDITPEDKKFFLQLLGRILLGAVIVIGMITALIVWIGVAVGTNANGSHKGILIILGSLVCAVIEPVTVAFAIKKSDEQQLELFPRILHVELLSLIVVVPMTVWVTILLASSSAN